MNPADAPTLEAYIDRRNGEPIPVNPDRSGGPTPDHRGNPFWDRGRGITLEKGTRNNLGQHSLRGEL